MKYHPQILPVLAGLALATPASAEPAENPAQEELKAEGKIEVAGEAEVIDAARPYLGLSTSPLPGFLSKHLQIKEKEGLLVRRADPEGPAAKAGLEADDIVTKFAGQAVGSDSPITELLKEKHPGDEVEVEYIHNGKPAKANIKLAERPAEIEGEDMIEGAGVIEGLPEGLPEMGGNLPPEIRAQIEKQMRDAMKRGVKGMGLRIVPGEGGVQIIPPGDLGELEGEDGAKPGIAFDMASSVNLIDPEGSIEMKSKGDGSEVTVRDNAGKEVWSGPWDTEQDKAAAPADIRARIGKLNLNVTPHLPGKKLGKPKDKEEKTDQSEKTDKKEKAETP